MAEKKLAAPALIMSDEITTCTCVRIGTYALFLCQNCAPIPFGVTDRGRREVGRMRQWDAIYPALVESNKARAALTRAALREGRRIEARVKRSSRNGKGA